MPTFKDFSVFIGNQATDSFNSIVIERMTQRKIDVELGRKTAVRQVERMTLLTLQVRISLIDKHRILIIEIRIQIPDTRTPDAHIISTTQILRLAKLYAQRNGRNQITKIRMKVLTRPHQILHLLYGLLITQSRFKSKSLVFQRISGISRKDMIQMTVLTATIFIICIVFICSLGFIKPIITGITSENILGTGFNRMQFPNRSSIVHLESLLHRICLSVRMEIL